MDVASKFIKEHGFAAEHRRRNETGFSSGVTVSQIRDHLLVSVPGLKEHGISMTTTRRLFEAPNKGNIASKRYKGYVEARVGIKANSYREYHIDAHYLFARNKQRRELACLLKDHISLVSMDDMAKVKVGPPAVSRYHQLNRIYPSNDMPNLSDHDFPVPGYLLNVSGYMFLEQSPNEDTPTQQDKQFDNVSAYDTVTTDLLTDTDVPLNLSVLDAAGMELPTDNSPQPLVETIVKQLQLHVNTKTTVHELVDVICAELLSDVTYYTSTFEISDEELRTLSSNLNTQLDWNESLVCLAAVANVFHSKITLFDLTSNVYVETCGRKLKNRVSPIFIAFHSDSQLTSSPHFKNELPTEYSQFIDNMGQQSLTRDNIGRLHLETPYSGPSFVQLRAQKFNSTTVSTHVTDLFNIISNNEEYVKKPALMLMSDGGPDFTPISVLNSIYFYRLFKRLDLDFLSVFTYAARYSAFNYIEHLWAPLSDKLSSVVLSSKLPGESRPPAQQGGLSVEALRKKESKYSMKQCKIWRTIGRIRHLTLTMFT